MPALKRPALVQRVAYVLDRCRDQRVMHLGCTNWPYTDTALADGSLLHLQLGRVARELHGIDADADGLQRLAERGVANLHRADLEALELTSFAGELDVIVAGEVIEHLSNPGRFLAGVQTLMAPSTTLLITTVNAYCAFRGAQYALRSRGGVCEPVHPDHVSYYSYATLTRMVERAGFSVDAFHFYDIGVEHRPYTPAHVRWFNAAAVAMAPHLADGLVVECRLAPSREHPAAKAHAALDRQQAQHTDEPGA